MKASLEEITRLVVEALARQGLPAAAPAEPDKSSAKTGEPRRPPGDCGCGCGGKSPSACPSAEPGPRKLSGRLVTQAELTGQLEGVRRLVVDRRAVVTPAAADLLREQGIELVRGDTPPAALRPAKRAITLGVWETRFPVGPLGEALKREGVAVTTVHVASTALVATVAGAVGGGSGVFVVTDRPHAAACQLNRDAQLRAAVAVSRQQWATIREELDPNVIVMRPTPGNLLDLKALAKGLAEFAGSQASGCGCKPK